jgi:hypothetical protein
MAEQYIGGVVVGIVLFFVLIGMSFLRGDKEDET